MRTHVVSGGEGLKLHVRDWGPPEAPALVLIHGWSQHHLCWSRQCESALSEEFRIVAMDIRGHGQSEAPLDPANYKNGSLWADDIAAVTASLSLTSPILVGWSYGGLIIGDYLRKYGSSHVAGINLVCAAIGIGPAWFGPLIGPDFIAYAPLACSEDQTVALKAIQAFLHRCFVRPVAPEDFELAVGWNMLTHPAVRAGLIERDEDFGPEFARFDKPLLVTFGAADTVVRPAMARVVQDKYPGCRLSEYQGTGHAPFLEDAARFNAELAEFAREAQACV